MYSSETKNLTDKVVLGLEALLPQPSKCWGHHGPLILLVFRLSLAVASKEVLALVTRSKVVLPLRDRV